MCMCVRVLDIFVFIILHYPYLLGLNLFSKDGARILKFAAIPWSDGSCSFRNAKEHKIRQEPLKTMMEIPMEKLKKLYACQFEERQFYVSPLWGPLIVTVPSTSSTQASMMLINFRTRECGNEWIYIKVKGFRTGSPQHGWFMGKLFDSKPRACALAS